MLKQILVMSLLAVGGVLAGREAQAQGVITVTIGVEGTNTDGQCSLREAIEAANTDTSVDGCVAGNGVDKIVFAPGVLTVTLSLPGAGEDANQSGDLDVLSEMEIDGGSGVVIEAVSGFSDRVLDVHSSLVLRNVVVRGGNIGGQSCGGGIRVLGTLRAISVEVIGNTSDDRGGGICVGPDGTLRAEGMKVMENEAKDGGGVYNSGVVSMTGSVVMRNRARAIGLGQGAGLFNKGEMRIERSTVYTNEAEFLGGTGGIYNYGVSAQLVMVNSTVGENRGIGIYNDLGAAALLTHVTVLSQTRYGLWRSSGILRVYYVVVGHNGEKDCQGQVSEGGTSLSRDLTCTQFTLRGVEPRVESIGLYGGETPNYRPHIGSPVLERATCVVTEDQRGQSRPQGVLCDLGSHEREATDLAVRKRSDPERVSATGVVTYVVEVENMSNLTATGIVMKDEVSGGMLLSVIGHAPSSASVVTGGGVITLSISQLAPGEVAAVTYTVQAGTEGEIRNVAVAVSELHDAPGENNVVSVTVPITAVAHLTASKAVTYVPSPFGGVAPNGTVTYTVSITNLGPSAALNVVMTDALPNGFVIEQVLADAPWVCNVTLGVVICQANRIEAGSFTQIVMRGRAPVTSGVLFRNVAVLDSPTEPPGETETPPAEAKVDEYFFVPTVIVP